MESDASAADRSTPSAPAARGRGFAAAFAFVFALGALLAPQAVDGAIGWILALVSLLVALGGFALIRALARTDRSYGPLVSLALLQALLVVPELGLRSAGFEHLSGIQFGYPHPADFWRLELDDELFWKLPADSPLANSLGFFGPEPTRPKPSGLRRLVMLGDSCSQQDHPFAWPELAARELSTSGRAWECVNLALSGYSSHQGLRVAQRWIAGLEPDLVAIYYGWNDHWLARGAPDSAKRPALAFERLYRASALLQALRKLLVGVGWLSGDAPLQDEPRVPLDEYRSNLVAIVALAREAGARVVLVTAPSTHDLAVPEYLLKHHFQRDAQAVVEEHRRYNEALRELAARHEAPLLDLERRFASRADREALMREDGIHFTEAGRVAAAREFVAFALEQGLVRP